MNPIVELKRQIQENNYLSDELFGNKYLSDELFGCLIKKSYFKSIF